MSLVDLQRITSTRGNAVTKCQGPNFSLFFDGACVCAPNKGTNSSATWPNVTRLAWTHRERRCHELLVPLPYSQREYRAKPLEMESRVSVPILMLCVVVLWCGLQVKYCTVISTSVMCRCSPKIKNCAGITLFICRNWYKLYDSVGFVPDRIIFGTFCPTQDETMMSPAGCTASIVALHCYIVVVANQRRHDVH